MSLEMEAVPDDYSALDGPGIDADLEQSLPASAYLSLQVFQQEKEHIFYRDWVCGGREEQIPQPGDFLAVDVLGESVLVVRDKDGMLRAYYNVCRHRGCRLALDDSPAPRTTCPGDAAPGPTGRFHNAIRCPYHSWTYAFDDGALRGSPFLRENERFRKEDFSLHPVGLDTWGGFFFLNLSPRQAAEDDHTLRAQLGTIPDEFQRYPLAELRTAHRIVYRVQANWKVVMENYNECYHCAGVHPELCDLVPAFKQNGGASLDWANGIPHREGAVTFTFSGTTNRAPFAGLSELERTRHKGQLIYPNLLTSFSSDHIAAFTLWPHSPAHTTVVCDFLFHPSEMNRDDFDPSDAVEFWDLVNNQDWGICAGVQRGMSSRAFTAGYYAPMEDASLDIRSYISGRLGTP